MIRSNAIKSRPVKPTVTVNKRPPAPPMEYTAKHKFEGHEDRISSLVFLHDNVHIVSGSWDGTMRKWDCGTGLLVGEPWKGEGGSIWSLALSPNGKMIACGRSNGSVQKWNTDGEMSAGILMGHSSWVRSVSWSPSGRHIASGSYGGTILIRKAESGEVKVGPIETNQGSVYSVAYSPSGDRIASGGSNKTICIWDSKTGELLLSPIKDLDAYVTSVVWSLDSSKLYFACDKFAQVFDSVSGTLLYHLEHDNVLNSIILSPKHNVLACVGDEGIAQLWDTESHQALGKPFVLENSVQLRCVSFSQDGQYLAYGGDSKKIALWMLQDIAPHLTDVTQEKTPPESPSSSCIEVDATNPFGRHRGDNMMEEGHANPYDGFFRSSQSSLAPAPSRKRRLWNMFSKVSVLRTPTDTSVRLQERLKHRFFMHRALPNSAVPAPAHSKPTERTPAGKAGGEDGERCKDIDLPDCTAVVTPGAAKQIKNKGKQREELPAGAQTSSTDDSSPPTNLDSDDNSKLWRLLMHVRGRHTTSEKRAPVKVNCDPSPEVVEAHTGSLSQAQASPFSHVMSRQSSELSHPSAVRTPSHLSQCPQSSSARYMWNALVPSWHRKPANESIPLQQRSKRGFFSQPTGPRPVTVYAARPKKLYWTAPRTIKPANQTAEQNSGNGNANAQTVQSTSAAVLTSATTVQSSTAQLDSRPYGLQSPQIQTAAHPIPEEYDFGCWGNFCLALWCIRRPLASATQLPAS